MMQKRVVVSKRWTGLGDCLISLLSAWRFAKSTDRDLIADWRFSGYGEFRGQNAFAKFFVAPSKWGCVSFSGDEYVKEFSVGAPVWPPFWNDSTFHTPPYAGERGDEKNCVSLIEANQDVKESLVVFDNCLTVPPPKQECRQLLEELRWQAPIATKAADFATAHLQNRPVVAIHVRHGNGGNIMGHARFWTNKEQALNRISKAIIQSSRLLKAAFAVDPVLFLCTDSPSVQEYLSNSFPELLTRAKTFRTPGAGELHKLNNTEPSAEDAAIEMQLLAHSDILIRFPPGSFFSFWASILKRELPITQHELTDLCADELGPSVV